MLAEKICKRCKKKESEEWWKCCPEHCTEQGPDVVCRDCKEELHPVCCAMNTQDFGLQELCGYSKGHLGEHTWETRVPPMDDPVPTAPETPSYVQKYTKIRKEEGKED